MVTAHMFRAQRRRLRTSAPQFPEVRENASRLILAVSPCSRMHKCRDTAGTRAAAVAQPRGAVSSLLGGRGCFLRFHRDRRTARVPQWPAAPLQQQCGALPRSHTQRYRRGRRLLAVPPSRDAARAQRSAPEPFAPKDGCKCKIELPSLHSSLFLGLSLEVLFRHLSSLVGDVLTNS